MYYLYFQSAQGQYHYGIPFEEFKEAIYVAGKYRNVAPSIMVTDSNDYSAFEINQGSLIHPQIEDFPGFDNVPEELDVPIHQSEYISLISMLDNENNLELSLSIECKLLASAARDNLNLHDFGWSRLALSGEDV